MSGTKEGGRKAAITNKSIYGEDFYIVNGALGGKAGRTGGFGSLNPGKDGLTGPQRASIAGKKGGLLSKRGSKKAPEGDSNG